MASPASPPPPPPPPYHGPTVASYGSNANGAVWFLTALSTVTLALRILSRTKIVKSFLGWDDAVMVLGWVVALTSSIVFSVCIADSAKVVPTPESMATQLPTALKINLISVSLGIMALFLPKVAITLLLQRMLRPRAWVAALLIGSSLCGVALGVVGVIIEYVQCDPIPGQWNPAKYHPKCWDPSIQINYSLFTGAVSATLDFAYAAYPAVVFWDLQMDTGRKVGVSILMGLGFISGAISIYKTTLIPLLAAHDGPLQELLYVSVKLAMWTNIEANIIITAACIAPSMPIVRLVQEHTSGYFSSIQSYLSNTRATQKSYSEFSKGNTDRFSQSQEDVELVRSEPHFKNQA